MIFYVIFLCKCPLKMHLNCALILKRALEIPLKPVSSSIKLVLCGCSSSLLCLLQLSRSLFTSLAHNPQKIPRRSEVFLFSRQHRGSLHKLVNNILVKNIFIIMTCRTMSNNSMFSSVNTKKHSIGRSQNCFF